VVSRKDEHCDSRDEHNGEAIMQRVSKTVAALVAGLAIFALVTPSIAQRAEDQMSGARAQALHQCNAQAGKLTQYTWGDHQIDNYRACMAQHGQQE